MTGQPTTTQKMSYANAVVCVLFLLFFLSLSVSGLELKCDKDHVYVYEFKQATSIFGGAYFHLEGNLELYCGERVRSKKLNSDLTITSLHFLNTVSYLKPPKCSKGGENVKTLSLFDQKCKSGEEKVKEMETPKSFDGLNHPFGFIQTSNGQIVRMFSYQQETDQIRDLKKAVVSQFQTNLVSSGQRVVEDNTGVHKVHYKQKKNADGSVTVMAHHDERDILEKFEKKNAEGTHQSTDSAIRVSKHGDIQDLETEASFEFGDDEKSSGVEYENTNHQEKNDISAYMSVSGSMHIKLIGRRSPHSKHKELHKILILTKHIVEGEASEESSNDKNGFTIEHLNVLDDEILKQKQLHQHPTRVDKSVYSVKDDIKKKVNDQYGGIKNLLDKFIEDTKLLALAIQYVKSFPKESLPHVMNKFDSLSGNFEKQSLIQGLMAESQSEEGTEMLLSTITRRPLNYKLIETGLFYTTAIEKPSLRVAKLLQDVCSIDEESLTNEQKEVIRTNAFLFLANVASKLDEEQGKIFIDFIIQTARQSEDDHEKEKGIVALHNMGQHKPEAAVDTLAYILDSDEFTNEHKVSAIHALRSHVNDEDGDHPALSHADTLIHNILSSDTYSHDIKVAAVRTQTHRQLINKNDRSIELLTNILKNPNTSEELKNSIHDYLKNVKNQKNVLDLINPDMKTLDGNIEETVDYDGDDDDDDDDNGDAKSLLFRRVTRVARRAVRAVSNVAKATAKAVADAAKAAAELLNVKKHAEDAFNEVKNLFIENDDRDFTQRCYETSSSGNNICVRDPYFKNMFSAVSKDLVNLKNSNHFVWEKRAGSDQVHAYIGFAALSGSRVPSCKDVSDDKSMLWAIMAGFSSYVKLLMFRVPILEVEFKFNRLKDQKDVDDIIYIRAGPILMRSKVVPGITLVYNDDAEFNAKSLMNCEPQNLDFEGLRVEKKLLEKKKTVMAGFIPLKLSVTVAAQLGLGIHIDVCVQTYRVMAGPAPYLKLSTEVSGGVTLALVDAKLEFSPESEVRAPILIGMDKCSFSSEIGLWFTPFSFGINFKIQAKPVKWGVSWPIYSYSMNPIGKNLYKYPTPGKAIPASEQGNPKPRAITLNTPMAPFKLANFAFQQICLPLE